jgi:hypothetical protein
MISDNNITAAPTCSHVPIQRANFMNQNPAHPAAPLADPAESSLSSQRSQTLHAGYWTLLVLSVLAAYGPLALVNQPFWDDWVIIAYGNTGALWEFFKQMGRREQYILMAPFTGNGDARACVLTVLFLYCVLAPLTYVIIRRITQWPATDAFWSALLTAVVPLDQARFVVATVPYACSSVFFALAIVVLLRDLDVSSLPRRILVLLLLVGALSTNSFLVLSWVLPAIVAIDAWRKAEHSPAPTHRLGATIRALLGRGELLLLPPVYWLAKQNLERPYGLYANYNQFRMGVPEAIKQTFITFVNQFGESAAPLIPRRSDLPELAIAAAVAIGLFVVVARIWHLPLKTAEQFPHNSGRVAGRLAFAAALALIFSALFPYVMVGQPPRFSGLWETRHQTTLTVVSGFAIFAILRSVVPRRYLWMSAAAIVTVFITIDISFTQRMINDALETHQIADLFNKHPPPPGTMMLVLEEDRQYRALGRFFSFYELSHLANAGQNGNPRMAISNQEVLDPATGDHAQSAVPAAVAALVKLCSNSRSLPQYGFGGFISNGQIETLKLIATREPPGLFQTINEAVRAVGAMQPVQDSNAMVRIVRETAPVGGACIAPCCTN